MSHPTRTRARRRLAPVAALLALVPAIAACGGPGEAPSSSGTPASAVAQRPAFDTVPAVTEGRVLEADDDVASRRGPRIVEFVEAVATSLAG